MWHALTSAFERTCPNQTFHRLQGHGPQIVHTGTRTGDNHCKLTAHLVAGKGMVRREFFRILDDVQVWEGGLDHDDIRALVNVAFLWFPSARMATENTAECELTIARRARPFAVGGSW